MKKHIDEMQLEDMVELLAAVDDEKGHHILWVDNDGIIHLDEIGAQTPASFATERKKVMRFRWETFCAGNGYVGTNAAANHTYVANTLAELREDYRLGKTGLIDY